ncbi:MAG TPA: GNAT family N-acetyltransferase [Thermoanaerobaculia bacterium]|nr:GNAT family N-acetyltransferase [Thermoanaerobaculia bacterium]
MSPNISQLTRPASRSRAPKSATMIRRAVLADAPALTRLMQESSAYHGAYRTILDGYVVSERQIRASQVYLAERNSAVLGFYRLVLTEAEGELDLMFVADAAQGQGLGTALFRHMREVAGALKCPRVMIVSHPPAESFYLRMGAIRIATRLPDGKVTWPRPVLVLPLD